MADSLKARVGRVIAGGVHALIDHLESQAPEAFMEQSLREAEAVIDDVRHELGLVSANRHLAQQHHARLNEQHDKLVGQVEEAFASGREDLARAAVARQLDIEAQIPVLETALAEQARQEGELQGYVAALLAKKREMSEALSDFRRSRAAATATVQPGGGAAGSAAERRMDAVTGAFDRLYERQTGLAGPARTTSLKQAAQLKELDDLVRDNKIAERMAQLKAGKGVNLFTTAQTFPFGVSFALIVLIAMIEGLGMLVSLSPSNLIDHALPDLHSDSSLDHTLGWLHVGKVPALVLLMLFLAGYTVFGYAMQMVVHGVFGFYVPAWAAGAIAVAPGLATVRGLGALIAHIIPRDETSAVSELALIGRAGVIASGTARRGWAAQARVRDSFGRTHYLMVEPDVDDEVFGEGVQVLIVQKAGAFYRCIANPHPNLL